MIEKSKSLTATQAHPPTHTVFATNSFDRGCHLLVSVFQKYQVPTRSSKQSQREHSSSRNQACREGAERVWRRWGGIQGRTEDLGTLNCKHEPASVFPCMQRHYKRCKSTPFLGWKSLIWIFYIHKWGRGFTAQQVQSELCNGHGLASLTEAGEEGWR